jgi:hypothetical protein
VIVVWLLELVLLILEGLGAIIPEVDTAIFDGLGDFADDIGSRLGGLNGFLPISEIAVVQGFALTVFLPFVVSFAIFRWLWQHLPYIGGGGS